MKIGSKQFKKLQKQWYKKLADDSFYDIEDERIYGKMKIRTYPNEPLKYIKRCNAIEQLINDPIFVIEMSHLEYQFFDKYRFSGNIRHVCNELKIKEQRGMNMIRKYQDHLDTIQQVKLHQDIDDEELNED